MESRTLSKAEQLKGLVELRDNHFHQMVQAAAEHEVQQCLDSLLSPGALATVDNQTHALAILGEMRGLRAGKFFLNHAIARLTQEVKVELEPQDVKTDSQAVRETNEV